MKRQILVLFSVLLVGCQESVNDRISSYINTIEIIDTHEHLQSPGDSSDFYFFNAISYFPSDIISAGAPSFENLYNEEFNVDKLWNQFGEYYNYSRTTSYHEQFMNSLRVLYGFDKPFLVKEDIKPLYEKMLTNNFRNHSEWFDYAYNKANIKTMILDQYWDHFNVDIDTAYFKLVCNINTCVSLVSEAAENKKVTSSKGLLQLMNQDELIARSIDDYINIIDSVLEIFKSNNAVCIKNSLAYIRSLDFEDVPYSVAASLYNKKGLLNEKEKKQLEDFVFHHIVQQSIKLELPIQIHTGYLAGNNSRLDNGHPMKLLNLLIKYPKARFILFHGGYPWTSDYVSIGKNFSNVYLDLVWLPQISKTEAIRTLHEMLDAVPYNKFMWGGDVIRIDDVVGSLELGKEVVSTVLTERVEKGWMTEEMAYDVARSIFRDNAIRIFRLKNN
jgi:uncharacterized protein